jgi:hypothetical protein
MDPRTLQQAWHESALDRHPLRVGLRHAAVRVSKLVPVGVLGGGGYDQFSRDLSHNLEPESGNKEHQKKGQAFASEICGEPVAFDGADPFVYYTLWTEQDRVPPLLHVQPLLERRVGHDRIPAVPVLGQVSGHDEATWLLLALRLLQRVVLHGNRIRAASCRERASGHKRRLACDP